MPERQSDLEYQALKDAAEDVGRSSRGREVRECFYGEAQDAELRLTENALKCGR
jgi:hypothetical protein